MFHFKLGRKLAPTLMLMVTFLVVGFAGAALFTDLTLVGLLHQAQAEHADQDDLNNAEAEVAFEEAFELGDELFETSFNALDGVGANVGQGQRFSRVPRADLDAPGEWAQHFPARATGPNAESCNSCHNIPFDDGAGNTASNVFRDPEHSGMMSSFIHRNTPHVMAMGAIQRLAEEMTDHLQNIRAELEDEVCRTRRSVSRPLIVQGINFGYLRARPEGHGHSRPGPQGECRVEFSTDDVQGIDADLVVRPFQWKGTVASVRAFNVDAAHNELGMQPVELVGSGQDGDFDGVTDEFGIGDITALTIYLAAQARPTTLLELADLDLVTLDSSEIQAINNGSNLFAQAQCASCHVPTLTLESPVFSEPSSHPDYRDAVLPSGDDPLSWGLDPENPISFDLTRDQPDNQILRPDGSIYLLGALASNGAGGAIINAYGDMKRHDMGPALAETIDETGHGAATFMTETLWGVGSTAPYLHDGRATTLTEAILAHGGEANNSRDAFLALSTQQQQDVIAFLNNLVLYKEP